MWLAMCARSPEGPTVSGAASKAAWPAGRGRAFCPSAPLWWDPTWSPVSSSGALSTGQTWSCWSGSRGGHKDDPRAGASLLWGKAERVGAVQPGEGCGKIFQYVKGAYKKDWDRLFSRACCNRTRCNGFKLKEGRFGLDLRKTFLTQRVERHWHRLPREVVDAPSLETFKARLDGALSNLI